MTLSEVTFVINDFFTKNLIIFQYVQYVLIWGMVNGYGGSPGMERGSWGWTLVHCSLSYSLGSNQHVVKVDKFDEAMMVMPMWTNLRWSLPTQSYCWKWTWQVWCRWWRWKMTVWSNYDDCLLNINVIKLEKSMWSNLKWWLPAQYFLITLSPSNVLSVRVLDEVWTKGGFSFSFFLFDKKVSYFCKIFLIFMIDLWEKAHHRNPIVWFD